MAIRTAKAEWKGNLQEGSGTLGVGSKVLDNQPYDFVSRFENGEKTNPEELLAAAHAACYSMALANNLSKAGYKVNSIQTSDNVHFGPVDGKPTLSKIEINCNGSVEGIDEAEFQKIASDTKDGCPIARAISVPFELNAKLV